MKQTGTTGLRQLWRTGSAASAAASHVHDTTSTITYLACAVDTARRARRARAIRVFDIMSEPVDAVEMEIEGIRWYSVLLGVAP